MGSTSHLQNPLLQTILALASTIKIHISYDTKQRNCTCDYISGIHVSFGIAQCKCVHPCLSELPWLIVARLGPLTPSSNCLGTVSNEVANFATSKTRSRTQPTFSRMRPLVLVAQWGIIASLTRRNIPSPKGFGTTACRMPIWRRRRWRCSCWHRPLPIHIFSRRISNSFLGNGGSAHHFNLNK